MEVTQSISFIISATNYIDIKILDFNATGPYDSLAASFAGCRAVLRENVEGYKASNRIERKSTCYPTKRASSAESVGDLRLRKLSKSMI